MLERRPSARATKVRDNQVVALHPSTGITHKPEWVHPLRAMSQPWFAFDSCVYDDVRWINQRIFSYLGNHKLDIE